MASIHNFYVFENKKKKKKTFKLFNFWSTFRSFIFRKGLSLYHATGVLGTICLNEREAAVEV